MKLFRSSILALCLGLASAREARAFCGFYVAKADAKIFNKASQVVLVRDGDKTVLTMANDFQGNPKEFAVVIPVPTFLEREQIHIGDKALVDHIDAYSAPRLVEYFDPAPCAPMVLYDAAIASAPRAAMRQASPKKDRSLGVKVEAEYTVGEYDIVILSAEQSNGLQTWLAENGYKIPQGAERILGSYIRQNMRFFVAKVNLKEQAKLGYTYLRPIQVAYESRKFMLPIRLGTVNANGPQELFVYALTKKGRVETTNYRVVKLPTDLELPVGVKENFSDFYKAMFAEQVKKEDMRVVFQEYAWDMGWCDPCAADPLSNDELRKLGVFWIEDGATPNPKARQFRQPQGAPPNVFVTRLHVRYDAAHFPEDLVFQATGDVSNFQGRYILRHPWAGNDSCPQAAEYRKTLAVRQRKEKENLATLTGWTMGEIDRRLKIPAEPGQPEAKPANKWYQKLWKD